MPVNQAEGCTDLWEQICSLQGRDPHGAGGTSDAEGASSSTADADESPPPAQVEIVQQAASEGLVLMRTETGDRSDRGAKHQKGDEGRPRGARPQEGAREGAHRKE